MNEQFDLSRARTGSENKPYLVIRNVTKRFGSFTALDDVSLDIYRGEFVSFLGPSGCGKTTLLRAISGLDVQTSGVIEQDGRDISRLPVGNRDFGIVFQSYALFPNLTVRDNVAYGLASEGVPREEITKRVTQLLSLVGLPDQARKYPIQLSGGQQQRAHGAGTCPVSRASVARRAAFGAGCAGPCKARGRDPRPQGRLGITTIMVTHDQEEALTMSDRIVVMNAGRIEQVGPPDEIYGRPATPFVADFVGRMNFLEGRTLDDKRIDVGEPSRSRNRLGSDVARGSPCVSDPRTSLSTASKSTSQIGSTCRSASWNLSAAIFSTVLHAAGTNLNVTADLSMNDVRSLGLVAGRSIPVQLPPARLKVFVHPPQG